MTTALPRVEREQHWKSSGSGSGRHLRKSLTYDEELYSTDHDMSHIQWIKKLTALYEHLAAQMKKLLMKEMQPEALTKGPAVLIPKDSQKAPIPSYYQLNT